MALGLVVLGAAGLLVLGHLTGLTFEERPVRASEQATELAKAALDYRSDTGRWPLNTDGDVDLAVLLSDLTGRPHRPESTLAETPGSTAGGWGQLGTESAADEAQGSWIRDLPLDPWGQPYRAMVSGGAIAVVSTGPNGTLDTEPGRLWSRPQGINPCDGDDIGFVLESDQDGGYQ